MMEIWATGEAYGSKVLFLMICVNGDRTSPGVAVEFSQRFRLKKTVVGYIDNKKELPRFGQLGGQGFIVLDGLGNVVSLRSKSFNRVRQTAFQQVEGWLSR